MQVVRVEPTPNPNAIKFVVGQSFPEGREFKSEADAGGHPLAREIYKISGIESLFFNSNYVTVSMAGDADWHTVHDSVTKAILAYEAYEAGGPGGAGSDGAEAAPGQLVSGAADDAELMDKIQAVLTQRVIPYLQADGGGMQLLGLDSKVLTISYQGACGSCPSSISGTLHAIEDMLKNEIDPEITVVPA